jgi:hypothetical protein
VKAAPEAGNAPARRPRPDLLALVLLVVFAFALGAVGSEGLLVGVGLAAIGISAGGLMRRARSPILRGLAPVPVLSVVGYSTLITPPSVVGEVLAGATGLALLFWLSAEAYPAFRSRDAAGALVFPGLALAVAVVASLILPGSPDYLGVATILLAAALLFAGWLYAHPADLAEAGSPSSIAAGP